MEIRLRVCGSHGILLFRTWIVEYRFVISKHPGLPEARLRVTHVEVPSHAVEPEREPAGTGAGSARKQKPDRGGGLIPLKQNDPPADPRKARLQEVGRKQGRIVRGPEQRSDTVDFTTPARGVGLQHDRFQRGIHSENRIQRDTRSGRIPRIRCRKMA